MQTINLNQLNLLNMLKKKTDIEANILQLILDEQSGMTVDWTEHFSTGDLASLAPILDGVAFVVQQLIGKGVPRADLAKTLEGEHGVDGELVALLLDNIDARSVELKDEGVRRVQRLNSRALVDFDWSVVHSVSSSSLLKLDESLVQLQLSIVERSAVHSSIVELNETQLDAFITSLSDSIQCAISI